MTKGYCDKDLWSIDYWFMNLIKYGIFGEKLEAGRKNELGRVLHLPSEMPEYDNIEEKYYAEEESLRKYMEDCKNEALELFSKWFYSLWD